MTARISDAGCASIGDSALAARLARAIEGEILFDPFSRGRYATDASFYQIEPLGVVVPRTASDVRAALEIAREAGVPVLPRGAGTSQCGQTVGEALVIDTTKHLDAVVDFDPQARRVTVEPGIVLDVLNRWLAPHGLWFPIDVSTSSRATIGGMAGNNSCGARSIRYGTMAMNVEAIEAVMADGARFRFAEVPAAPDGPPAYRALVEDLRALAAREQDEIARRFPKLMRRVGGYNIDDIDAGGHNMARLLVGSEGTLAFFTQLTLALAPVPAHRVLGICHFPTFRQAMEATKAIVALEPTAVELVDPELIRLARAQAAFRPTIEAVVEGEPGALLLVEFAGDEAAPLVRRLAALGEVMGDLGLAGQVVEAVDPALQRAVWAVRKAGLNILMSMKGDGKPVSFIEDCAVALDDLADYTEKIEDVFRRHGTRGTWYAHASVGCLHVRPILNLKDGRDVAAMRVIAEEAFALVRAYKGSHSGEHGDGLTRSEFHEAMFGPRLVRAFEAVKDRFDPDGLFNPGKIVRPHRMDDRALFRFKPDYRTEMPETALDWSAWGGFAGAVEMCNNNGACRKLDAGVMCPSFRATRDERDSTRGRANTLRLAISGQLGPDALTSEAMRETLALCVGCKACRRECPTGVDMARMKTEFLYHYNRRHGLSLRDRLIAGLPRHAPFAARLAPVLSLRDRLPGAAALSERVLGLAAGRSLPRFRRPFRAPADPVGEGREVVLFVDTFTTWFAPEVARSALAVLVAAGCRVHVVGGAGGPRRCCGRTFLAAGLVDEARREARRALEALGPHAARGVPVIGLEPSCLFTFRDEFEALLPGAARDLAARSRSFASFVVEDRIARRLRERLGPLDAERALVHGHCHEKAFDAFDAVIEALALVPGLAAAPIEAGCCGMAGAFGYAAEHYEISMRMAEDGLLPAVRDAASDTILVADGVSCRHQIADGAGREALHVARVLHRALGERGDR